ncbi:MAG: hypothetical protein PHE47_06305 [Oscillospiraceae bacterium]|nr:hypothetical protein [Oscillospiraceae bacterium]
MKICVPVRVKDCRVLLRQNLDSRFDFGMERHVGWVIACFFSMVYHSGNEVGLRYSLISHKAMGFLSGGKNGTDVYYVVFRGMTDPVSLLLLFLGSFLVIWFAWEGQGAPFVICVHLALLITALVAGATYLVSAFSGIGRQAHKQLKGTLRNLLTNITGV